MKLPIKKKYFDMIKNGKKELEYRDSHITFVCEETKETLRKEITRTWIEARADRFKDVCKDNWVIVFELE